MNEAAVRASADETGGDRDLRQIEVTLAIVAASRARPRAQAGESLTWWREGPLLVLCLAAAFWAGMMPGAQVDFAD